MRRDEIAAVPQEDLAKENEGLRGEYSIAELCRREGIAQSLYYS